MGDALRIDIHHSFENFCFYKKHKLLKVYKSQYEKHTASSSFSSIVRFYYKTVVIKKKKKRNK